MFLKLKNTYRNEIVHFQFSGSMKHVFMKVFVHIPNSIDANYTFQFFFLVKRTQKLTQEIMRTPFSHYGKRN